VLQTLVAIEVGEEDLEGEELDRATQINLVPTFAQTKLILDACVIFPAGVQLAPSLTTFVTTGFVGDFVGVGVLFTLELGADELAGPKFISKTLPLTFELLETDNRDDGFGTLYL
jgi:hypothetical protein